MELVYEARWTTYEEWGGIEIYEDSAGNFSARFGGYSVMAPPGEPAWGECESISGATVLLMIDEWTKIEKEYENYFN
jgi:hypothetical protein